MKTNMTPIKAMDSIFKEFTGENNAYSDMLKRDQYEDHDCHVSLEDGCKACELLGNTTDYGED